MSGRKLSKVSAQEMKMLHEALRAQFQDFCAFGAGQRGSDGMDGRTFAKFTRDSGLLDKKLTSTDVDLIFTKVKLRGKRKLNFACFQEGVRQLAIKKGMTYQEMVELTCTVGGPTNNQGTIAEANRFHDDESLYSGVYKAGGPSTTSSGGVQDIGHILDRSDYDIRGRKIGWENSHQESSPSRRVSARQRPSTMQSSSVAMQNTATSVYDGGGLGAGRGYGGGPQATGIRRATQLAQQKQSRASPQQSRQQSHEDAHAQFQAQQRAQHQRHLQPQQQQPQQQQRQPQQRHPQQRQQQPQQSYSEEEMNQHIESKFNKFVSFGNRGGHAAAAEMDSAKFLKFCKDCGIVTSRFTSTDVDLCFTKAKDPGTRRLAFPQLLQIALPLIAQRKGVSLEQLKASIMRSSGPRNTGGTVPLANRFHDDKSLYSGVHGRGGPSTANTSGAVSDISQILDRSDYDVRGRKIDHIKGSDRGAW